MPPVGASTLARILLVEDDAAIRRLLAIHLADAGHDVVEAADATDALDRIERDAIDAVVTDILMPDMDGLELILAVRRRGLDLAILATSGGGAMNPADILGRAAALGADTVPRKPFRAEQLHNAVNAILAAAISTVDCSPAIGA